MKGIKGNTFFPVRIILDATGEELEIARIEDMPDGGYRVTEVSPLSVRKPNKVRRAS